MLYSEDQDVWMFCSFLTAIKSFAKDFSGDDLSQADFGEYFVSFIKVPQIDSYIVFVLSKKDEKEIRKVVPGMINIIIRNENLFNGSEYSQEDFRNFDKEVIDFLFSQKKIIDKSLIKKKGSFLMDPLAQTGKISKELRRKLISAKELLIEDLKNVDTHLEKLDILKNIVDISNQLKDEDLIKYQEEANTLSKSIGENKVKLKYYIKQIKEAIFNKDYKNVYSNLYSFSLKLNNLAKPRVYKKYRELADKYLDCLKSKNSKFWKLISDFKKMDDDIEKFFVRR